MGQCNRSGRAYYLGIVALLRDDRGARGGPQSPEILKVNGVDVFVAGAGDVAQTTQPRLLGTARPHAGACTSLARPSPYTARGVFYKAIVLQVVSPTLTIPRSTSWPPWAFGSSCFITRVHRRGGSDSRYASRAQRDG